MRNFRGAFLGVLAMVCLWATLAWGQAKFDTTNAPPQTLTLQDLVNRPDHWPPTVTIKANLRFNNGVVINQGDKMRLARFDGKNVLVVASNNMPLSVRLQDSDLLADANEAWSALTPAQRAIDAGSLLADMSLWPAQVTATGGITSGFGKLPPGAELALVSLSEKGAAVAWPNSSKWIDIDFASTDVFARARQLVLIDRDKRPSRMAAALKEILVDANGKPYHDEHLEDRRIFAIYYGAGWCPPCRDFSPDLVKFLDAALPRHPELAAVYLSDDKQPADMFAYMREEKMPCPAVELKDLQQSHFLASYLVEIIPHMAVVDRFGKVLASNDDNHGNRTDPKDTLDALSKLLASPATKP